MHALVAFALSLALAAPKPWDGPNGFDPTSVFVLRQGTQYFIDGQSSPEFENWLADDSKRRAAAFRYFVTCAFDRDVVIKSGTAFEWRGALGLAPSLAKILSKLPDSGKDPRKWTSAPLTMSHSDGEWVSACLMALANGEGRHQYVYLRGNPPPWRKDPILGHVSGRKAWTFGLPEGVFFADLLNFNTNTVTNGAGITITVRKNPPLKVPPRPDLERNYTMSLNLPDGYLGLPPEWWAPPNASLGRTLDFDQVTIGSLLPVFDHYKVASRLGEYPGPSGGFAYQSLLAPFDKDYPYDTVCVAFGQAVVPCGPTWANPMRPIFVHAARVAGLAAAATNALLPGVAIQALDSGTEPISDLQRVACLAGTNCIGPSRPLAVGEKASDPPEQPSQILGPLQPGQSVTTVLRYDPKRERHPLTAEDRIKPFTAIIRFRSKVEARARIEVSARDGSWVDHGMNWPDTKGEWDWMQVYPVYPAVVGNPAGGVWALKVRVSGPPPKEGTAPTLDVAGFVSVEPWCLPVGQLTWTNICPDTDEPPGPTVVVPISPAGPPQVISPTPH